MSVTQYTVESSIRDARVAQIFPVLPTQMRNEVIGYANVTIEFVFNSDVLVTAFAFGIFPIEHFPIC